MIQKEKIGHGKITRPESIRSFRGIYVKSEIMSRVLPAQNDVLTPFDLRAQISRVNVELSAIIVNKNFFEKVRN